MNQLAHLHIPQLYSNLNFSITVQACSWPSTHESTNTCIVLQSLLLHLYPPQLKGEQKFPYIFMIIFCEPILIFSVHCYVSYPHQCGYLRHLTKLKDTTFTPFCQQQQQSATMRTGWEKVPFHFFSQHNCPMVKNPDSCNSSMTTAGKPPFLPVMQHLPHKHAPKASQTCGTNEVLERW